MIDFRYHAMSLAAVFVALAVGLLLGVTLGDTGLVSNVRGDLERSLSANLASARDRSALQKLEIKRQNDFLKDAYPQMVADRLTGTEVAVIGSRGATRGVLDSISDGLEPSGARVAFAAELVAKPRYVELARELRIRGVDNADEPSAGDAEQIGRAAGRKIARGRSRLSLRRFVFSRLSGRVSQVRLFVFARADSRGLNSEDGKLLNAFERGVVAGIAQGAARIVGVEKADDSPSHVRWYNDLGLSTVDSIDRYAGRYALVLVLGGAKGDYGFKDSADAVIPPVAP